MQRWFHKKRFKIKRFWFSKQKMLTQHLKKKWMNKNKIILQKYFFWGYLKWWKTKQNRSGLNRALLLNFRWLKSINNVKFTVECGTCTEKHVFVKKVLRLGFTTTRQCVKYSLDNIFPVKENFWTQWSVKELLLTVFMEIISDRTYLSNH